MYFLTNIVKLCIDDNLPELLIVIAEQSGIPRHITQLKISEKAFHRDRQIFGPCPVFQILQI